ncbi:MAG TPA: hypothetical protein VF498_19655, partial [Anaerolineales bacterium]
MSALDRQARLRAFERHIRRLDQSIAGLQGIDGRYFWARLVVLSAGLLATVLAFIFGRPGLGWGMLLTWAATFTVVVFFHRKVDDSLRRFRMARGIAAAQAARMTLNWEQVPLIPAGTLSEPLAGHPFAPDLDLLGDRSLLQLLDTAFSSGGSRRLAGWVLNTRPDLQQIHDRQAVVQEMKPLSGFRNRLALNSALAASAAGKRWQSDRLLAWLESPSEAGKLRSRLILLAGLAALDLVLLLLSLFAGLPAYWAAALVVYLVAYFMQHRAFEDLFDQAY